MEVELNDGITLRVILKSKIAGKDFNLEGALLADEEAIKDSSADPEEIKNVSDYFIKTKIFSDKKGKDFYFSLSQFGRFGFNLNIPLDCDDYDYKILENFFGGTFEVNSSKSQLLWKADSSATGKIWIEPKNLPLPYNTQIHKIYILSQSDDWLEEPVNIPKLQLEMDVDGLIEIPKLVQKKLPLEKYFDIYPLKDAIHLWQVPYYLGAAPNIKDSIFLSKFPKSSEYKNLYKFQDLFNYLSNPGNTQLNSKWQIRICDSIVRSDHPFFKKVLDSKLDIRILRKYKIEIKFEFSMYKSLYEEKIKNITSLLNDFLPITSIGERDFDKPNLSKLKDLMDGLKDLLLYFKDLLSIYLNQDIKTIKPFANRGTSFDLPLHQSVRADFEQICSVATNLQRVLFTWTENFSQLSRDTFRSYDSHGTECFASSLIFFPFPELFDNIVSVGSKIPQFSRDKLSLRYNLKEYTSLTPENNSDDNDLDTDEVKFGDSFEGDEIEKTIYSISFCESVSLEINPVTKKAKTKTEIITDWEKKGSLNKLKEVVLTSNKNSLFCLCSGNNNILLMHNLINEDNTIQVGGIYFDNLNPVFSDYSVGHKEEDFVIGPSTFTTYSVDICGIIGGIGKSDYCLIPSYDVKEDLTDWNEKNGIELIKKSKWLYSGIMGTSIATPQIASICALIFEVWPQCEIKYVKLILHASGKEIKSGTSANGVDISKMEVKFKDESIVPDNLKKIPPRLAQIDKALELTEFCKNEMAKSGNTRSIKEIVSAWLNPTK